MLLPPKAFITELVNAQIITQEQANKYEIESLQSNDPIDVFLTKTGDFKKDELLKIKAHFLNVPYVDIASAAIDPQALSYIQDNVARRYTILPYQFDTKNDTLHVATSDPLNVSIIDFLEKKTGKKIILTLAFDDDMKKAIEVAYPQSLSPEVKEALKEVAPQESHEKRPVAPQDNMREAPMAKILNTILEFAVKSRASDIHIEPQEAKTRVRYRIDGILQEKLTLPRGIHDSLTSRIKILSEMKIDEKRIPQDGRFAFKMGAEEVDLRVNTLPTVHGEKTVMRLLKKTGGMPTLNDLGLRGPQFKDLEEAINKPYGIVLVTGPTGSGKTTTLYSVLTRLNKTSVNIVTLEDPVEYQIAGINQVQINVQAGLTFANGLRSFLRQDPNIILVGEIRDKETTQLAIQAALTGHLVFSTLHTNDAATAIPRLIDLGGEPFLIASVLNASIAQRIIRRVCSFCKEQYEANEAVQQNIREVLGQLLPQPYVTREKPMLLTRGRGCNECGNTGYTGRIAIFEVLKFTPILNKMILASQSAKDIETQARKDGGLITIKEDGYLKVLDGLTTIEEVLRVAEA